MIFFLTQGPQAAQLGVIFPAVDDAQLARTVLVGGLSPFATPEALQAVFALQNRVRSINFAGASRAFAFIEFHTQAEAEAAVRMTGVTLLGQALRVESALAARNAAQGAPSVGGPAAAASPFLALQAQQVQVYQMMQVQQAALARQVAQLRAAQSRADDAARKAGGDARGAALAAAEHLSRKIGNDRAEKDAGRGRDRAEREERDRGRDRRDRDRDRDRRDRDKDSRRYRSRSRDRGRYGSRRDDERRHRDRRSRSRDRSDRRRDRRHRSRSRDRSRERRRHRSRSAEADGRRGVKDMEVERGPPEEHGRKASPAVSKPPPTPEDELEALLMELDG